MLPELAGILDNYYEALAVVDRHSLVVVDANPCFIKRFRNDGDDPRGKSISVIIGWSPVEDHLRKMYESIQGTGLFRYIDSVHGRTVVFSGLTGILKDHFLVRVAHNIPDETIAAHQELLDRNVAGVFRTYLNGGFLYCNEAFASMFGYTVDELMSGNAASLYLSDEDRQAFVKDLKVTGTIKNYEIHLRTKEGRKITCLENTLLTRDGTGREVISGTIVEITRLKDAERALQEGEQRFRSLADMAHEGIVFCHQDRIIDCNEQFARLIGFTSPSDVIGRMITEFFTNQDIKRIQVAAEISPSNRTEVRTSTQDNKVIIIDVTADHIRYQNQDTWVLVINDITARKKAEYTLEQTVLRLRNLLENSPIAVLILTDDRIRYANHAALVLLGYDYEDDLYDKNFFQYVPANHKKELSSDIERVRHGAEIGYREIELRTRSGDEVHVGIKSSLTIYENKPSIQVSLNNISERMQLVQEQMRIRIIEEINTVLKKEIEEHKLTQQRLEVQERYNRNLIQSSLDMIIASDENHCISEFNRAAELQFGYTKDEVVGKNITMLYENDEEFKRIQRELLNSGRYVGEVQNVKSNGENFTSLMSASLIIDENNRRVGSMGVSRDITEFRANERRAMEQKAKLESIFNSTENLMMWTMGRDYCITTLNSNFKHWMQDQIGVEVKLNTDIYSTLVGHLDEDVYQGQMDAFRQAFNGRPQQFEIALKDLDQKTVWLQAFLNPVYLGDKLEEISVLAYDNTERKTIDRRIREALREKEVLLSEIHHRVKNNLQVISSILNLQSSYVSDEHTLDILKESQNRIKSMSFIHETLYRTTDFSSIDFADYIKTLTFNLIQSYRTHDCHVEFIPDIENLSIHIDKAIPCGLIVNELISNALKYAFTGRQRGTLSLELKRKEGKIHLSIADDGNGLPENFSYEKTDSLGIQLVYTLIEQLDGNISVESSRGKGTRFLVTFE